MLRIYQIGSLKAWIITVQIFGIYGENEPKPTCETCSSINNKLSAVYSVKSTERLN